MLRRMDGEAQRRREAVMAGAADLLLEAEVEKEGELAIAAEFIRSLRVEMRRSLERVRLRSGLHFVWRSRCVW